MNKEKRIKGEFFTEKSFVDKSHDYISNYFGDDWKERYIVWDNCCGTNNLTKDYNFKKIYCSSLEQKDIDAISEKESLTKFTFDFLNDDYSKLPNNLKEDIESGKDIFFFINPPYFKANPMKEVDGTDVSKTVIGEEMIINKYGMASSQLSTQFLYRILKIKKINPNIKICVYNIPNYMTTDGFKVFRNKFLNEFGFVGGFLFNASNFSDTSNRWGISFSIWDHIINDERNNFIHDVIEVSKSNELIKTQEKNIYNCDGLVKANVFFKQMKEKKNILLPPMKSFITIDKEAEK